MRYTQVRPDSYGKIQLNAGIVLRNFTPETGEFKFEDIMGSTTGGGSFDSGAEYYDFGEDIDNVPANTMELKRVKSYKPVATGNFVTLDTPLAKDLIAAADIVKIKTGISHIIPRSNLKESDFVDFWFVGDYSAENSDETGGYCAVHVKRALNTGGFKWQSTKDGKGQFAYNFEGHYTLANLSDMPFELYIFDPDEEIPEETEPSEYSY